MTSDKPTLVNLIDQIQKEDSVTSRTLFEFYNSIWVTAVIFKIYRVDEHIRQQLLSLSKETWKLCYFYLTGDSEKNIDIKLRLEELKTALEDITELVTSRFEIDTSFLNVCVQYFHQSNTEAHYLQILSGVQNDLLAKRFEASNRFKSIFGKKKNWSHTSTEEWAIINESKEILEKLMLLNEVKEQIHFLGLEYVDIEKLLGQIS